MATRRPSPPPSAGPARPSPSESRSTPRAPSHRCATATAGAPRCSSGGTASPSDPATWPELDGSAVWARDVVSAPTSVRPAVEQLLERVALVPDRRPRGRARRAGRRHHRGHRRRRRLRPGLGPRRQQRRREPARAAGRRRRDPHQAGRRDRQWRARPVRTRARPVSAPARSRADVEAALEALHDSDARMAAVAERLGQPRCRRPHARPSRGRAHRARHRRGAPRPRAPTAPSSTRSGRAPRPRPSAEPTEEADDPSTDERDRLELAASRARTAETELRLTLRTREERARALKGRADSLEGAARNELAARERLRAAPGAPPPGGHRRRSRARRRGIRRRARGCRPRPAPPRQRDAAEADRAPSATRRLARCAPSWSRAAGRAARPHRHRAPRRGGPRPAAAADRALQAKAVEELGIDPEVLVEEFGPHQLVPHVAGPGRRPRRACPSRRRTSARSRRSGCARPSAGCSALGRVNPLALEEFAALEERHTFLTDAARGPQEVQARPARHRQGGRRAGRAGVHRGVPRHRGPVRAGLRAALPRRRGHG